MDHGGADVCYCRLTHVCEGRYARRQCKGRPHTRHASGRAQYTRSLHAAAPLCSHNRSSRYAMPALWETGGRGWGLFPWEPRSAITEIRYIEVRYCEGLLYILQAQQIRITVKDMEIMHKTVQIKLQIISIILNSS